MRATVPSTTKTKKKQVRYTPAISAPSCSSVPMPYAPIVNAMAPNAPMGATRISMLIMRNSACENWSITAIR